MLTGVFDDLDTDLAAGRHTLTIRVDNRMIVGFTLLVERENTVVVGRSPSLTMAIRTS